MAAEVIMPKVDMDQETGTVVQWVRQEGDTVKQGEIILVIETDKVAIDVESPASGILSGILVEEGETVPIATTIAYVLEPGEALPDGAKPTEPAKEEKPSTTRIQQVDWEVTATPVARKIAEAEGIDLSSVSGTGPYGQVTKKDIEEALEALVPVGKDRGKVYATPAAKRIGAERGVELSILSGSGPDGRIQAADVVAAAERAALAAVAMPAPAPIPEPVTAQVNVIPLLGIRRTIAERLTTSYQQAPHIGFTWRNDMTQFNKVRKQLNTDAKKMGIPRISVTALIIKIVASVLERHPWLNASFQGEEIHLYPYVNIGMAVALDTGLIVPVIHNVGDKGIATIASEVEDLAVRARDGQLIPAEVRGGTFTISNLGPFGVEQFNAIINPPEAAILATGATQNQVIADENGKVAVRPIMRTTLTADHRVVEGVAAAHFIADLKASLEAPVSMVM